MRWTKTGRPIVTYIYQLVVENNSYEEYHRYMQECSTGQNIFIVIMFVGRGNLCNLIVGNKIIILHINIGEVVILLKYTGMYL